MSASGCLRALATERLGPPGGCTACALLGSPKSISFRFGGRRGRRSTPLGSEPPSPHAGSPPLPSCALSIPAERTEPGQPQPPPRLCAFCPGGGATTRGRSRARPEHGDTEQQEGTPAPGPRHPAGAAAGAGRRGRRGGRAEDPGGRPRRAAPRSGVPRAAAGRPPCGVPQPWGPREAAADPKERSLAASTHQGVWTGESQDPRAPARSPPRARPGWLGICLSPTPPSLPNPRARARRRAQAWAWASGSPGPLRPAQPTRR